MTISHVTAARWLRRATLAYLGLPVVIFFIGWFRAPLAVGLTAILIWMVWKAGWRGRGPANGEGGGKLLHVPLRALIAGGLLPAIGFVAMSGAGGWGAGDSDWFKHDTILYDLVTRSWPVTYQTSRGPLLLVYYMAFYLPAALLGKCTASYFIASQALAATMLIGILLSLAWLVLLGQSTEKERQAKWWLPCLLFFGFSGMDVLGKAGVNVCLGLPPWHGDWRDIEWWAQAFQYSSNAAALFWAPQHAIGAWLPTALVLADFLTPSEGHPPARTSGLPMCLAFFWSPFAAVGLAPVAGACGWFGRCRTVEPETWRSRIAAFLNGPNALSLALVLPLISYYAARSAKFPVPSVAEVLPGRSPMPLVEGHLERWLLIYAAFIMAEFGLLALALAASFRGEDGERCPADQTLLAVATCLLLLLPTVHYGYANDLVMRGGLPALWVLQVLLIRRFGGVRSLLPDRRRWPVIVCAAVLMIGMVNAGLEYRRHLEAMWRAGSWRDLSRDDFRRAKGGEPPPVFSLFQLQRTLYHRPGFDFARQYLGGPDTFYGRLLAPRGRSMPQPVAE